MMGDATAGESGHGMLRKIRLGWLALKDLGVEQVCLYALYRLGLASGYFRLRTPARPKAVSTKELKLHPIFVIPTRDEMAGLVGGSGKEIIREADEIVSGQVRIFGGPPAALNLAPPDADRHWSRTRFHPGEDIKFTWEPARFGWAFNLGRAYLLTSDERYPEAFWQHWEQFTAGNPVNCGPNWESGQEVALRLIAYLFAAQVFEPSARSTPGRKAGLLKAVADHAERIPPTMIYARAQNNNHLVSEACGLYLAGVALPEHSHAAAWKQTGWRWLEYAFRSQIDPDGTYVQHSLNYHRMVLHLALLAQAGARTAQQEFSPQARQRLAAATRWLLAQVDWTSGDASNLGNNDGANILPFGVRQFRDHLPTAQAVAAAFLAERCLPPGPWDEMAAWLGIAPLELAEVPKPVDSPAIQRLGNTEEWATLRGVRFRSRPAHADQLQVDLWYRGINVLLDPGTYLYTHKRIWNNGLVNNRVHNSPVIDDLEPMLRAGRFLWLKWDQAHWIENECQPGKLLTAEHDGYQPLGIRHRRALAWRAPGRWQVTDWLTPVGKVKQHRASLQWLLPDWEWSLDESELILTGSQFKVSVSIQTDPADMLDGSQKRLVRGGGVLAGKLDYPDTYGWFSPTYGSKVEALSYQVEIHMKAPVKIITNIQLEPVIFPS
ncbi:MAG: alginate lyase family protein [Chloroflexi bacterium]|nr:MAG: alginate lyase family protein [Chloroflexota bacterium]